MKYFRINSIGSMLFMFLVIVIISCKSDSDEYYGQGFGMGFASGCFDSSENLQHDLNLTGSQIDKIREIDSVFREKYYKNRTDFNMIEDLRKKHHAEIDAILTPAQKTKFDEIYLSRWSGWGRKHMYRHMGGYYGAGYGMGFASGCFGNKEIMKNEMDLTAIQANAIDEIDKEYRDKYYKNRNDYDKIESLRCEQKKAIENVLTSEQKRKYEKIYNERWRGWGMHRGMGSMMDRMGNGMMWH